MKVTLIQMTSSDDPQENAAWLENVLKSLSATDLVVTPEATNMLTSGGKSDSATFPRQEDDPVLSVAKQWAKANGTPVLLGSLLLSSESSDKAVNRAIYVDESGEIGAFYDKVHLFDVELGQGQNYRESARFEAGHELVTLDVAGVKVGLSICYDLRFPHLYRALSQNGAKILFVPAAFTPQTGRAHWEVLLRARAIENSAFVIAPAQVGTHRSKSGHERQTYGHSLVVSPWGEVIFDAGKSMGASTVEIHIDEVDAARQKIPAFRVPNLDL